MPVQRAWLVTISRTISVDADVVCRVYPERGGCCEGSEPQHADIEDIRVGSDSVLHLDPDDLDRYERMEIEGSAVRAAFLAAMTDREQAAAPERDAVPDPANSTRHQKA